MPKRFIARVVIGYLLIAALYITASDWLLFAFWPDAAQIPAVSVAKGWGFVLVTAGTLWALMRLLRTEETGRFRALLNNHHAVVLVIDPASHRIVDCSLAAETFYGWSRPELLSKRIDDINTLTPEELQIEMARATQNAVPVFHFRHRRADGAVRDVDVYAGPVTINGQSQLLSIVHDVTDSHAAQRSLEQLNQRYELLYRGAELFHGADSIDAIYDGLCRVLVDHGAMDSAWIGIRTPQETLRRIAAAGAVPDHDPGCDAAARQALGSGLAVAEDAAGALPGAGAVDDAGVFAYPFFVEGKAMGVLCACHAARGEPQPALRDTLAELAKQLGDSINDLRRRHALETSENVIEASPVVLFRWQYDEGWPIAFVSANVSQWGYRSEELVSGREKFARMVHPEDLPRLDADVEAQLEKRATAFTQRYRILTLDGVARWVEDRTSVQYGEDGSVSALQATVTDVDALHTAELAREESERRFRRAIEKAPMPIVMHADDGRVLAVSDGLVELTGYQRAEIVTISDWTQRAYGDNAAKVSRQIAGLHELKERVHEGELTVTGAQGQRLIWDFSSVPLGPASDGRRIVLSIAADVTARKSAEEALALREAQLSRVLNHAPEIVFTNRDDRVTYINPTGVRKLGADDPAQLLGRSIYELFKPSEHEKIRARIGRLRREPGSAAAPLYEPMLTLTGDELATSVSAVSYAIDGEVEILVTCRDITEQRKAEATVAEYVKRLEGSVLGTAAAVSQMVELRDPYTAGHEWRVGELAAAIGEELGLDAYRLKGLRVAGAVHDVGKIRVPAEVLSRPGRLSRAEYDLVKEHAEQGYLVLKPIDFPWPIAETVRQHHERLDGSGYPRGLTGDAILLEARIIAVADVVESMASHRPYRAAHALHDALAELRSGAGRLYDRRVVDACCLLFEEKGYVLPQPFYET